MTSDLHDLAALYAVDALDADEAERFARHLPGCPACQRELVALRTASTALALAVATPLPAGLRDRILADAGRSPQVAPAPAVTHRSGSRVRPGGHGLSGRRWRSGSRVRPGGHRGPAGGVDRRRPGGPGTAPGPWPTPAARAPARDCWRPLPPWRRWRCCRSGPWWHPASGGAAAVTASTLPTAGPTPRLLWPGSERRPTSAPWSWPVPTAPCGWRGRPVATRSCCWPTGYPTRATVGVYELWRIDAAGPDAAGLFDPDDTGAAGLVAPLDGADPAGWGVTVEPDGGSAQPTPPIVYQAEA